MNQNEENNNNGSNLVRTNAIHPPITRTVTDSNESEIATQLDEELIPTHANNPFYRVVSFANESAANPPQNNVTNANAAANPGTAIVPTVTMPLDPQTNQQNQMTN